jgi:hypothetical protein
MLGKMLEVGTTRTNDRNCMAESWINPNRRVLAVALAGPLLLLALGAAGMAWGVGRASLALSTIGGMLMGLGLLGSWLLLQAMRQPILAFADGFLLVRTGEAVPARVPIDAIEVFFLGQGPALPSDDVDAAPTTKNVVVRLAEAAVDWHQHAMRADLGRWCGGYIVLRGTWCEPLCVERLNELNRRLAAVRREQRELLSVRAQEAK